MGYYGEAISYPVLFRRIGGEARDDDLYAYTNVFSPFSVGCFCLSGNMSSFQGFVDWCFGSRGSVEARLNYVPI